MEFKYEINCGSREAMEMIAKKGRTALNPKTMKWQIIDKDAKYQIRVDKVIKNSETGEDIECCTLLSDKDLWKIAEEKGLICSQNNDLIGELTMKNAYRTLFNQAFRVSLLCDELMDFIPEDVAFNFIKEKFKEEYTPKEVLKLEEEYSYCILGSMSDEDKIVTLMDLFDLEYSESETIVNEFKKQ